MPSKSPYAVFFKTAVNRGTPCWTAVVQIATRTGVTPSTIFKSLFKVGLVLRQKFNGQWIYWPTTARKSTTTHTKTAQTNLWQCFIDWCICSGHCTPRQFTTHKGSQSAFTQFFSKFWATQFPHTTVGFGSWPMTGRFTIPFGTTRRVAKPRRKTRRTGKTTRTRGSWTTPKTRRTWTTTTRSRSTTPSYKISRYRKTSARRYRRAA